MNASLMLTMIINTSVIKKGHPWGIMHEGVAIWHTSDLPDSFSLSLVSEKLFC